jgi:hypothetical protein
MKLGYCLGGVEIGEGVRKIGGREREAKESIQIAV